MHIKEKLFPSVLLPKESKVKVFFTDFKNNKNVVVNVYKLKAFLFPHKYRQNYSNDIRSRLSFSRV